MKKLLLLLTAGFLTLSSASGATWTKVTSAADLTFDGEYVIACAQKGALMSYEKTGSALSQLNLSSLTGTTTEITELPTGTAIVKFEGSTWAAVTLHLYAEDGTSKGYYKTSAAKSMSLDATNGTSASVTINNNNSVIDFNTPGKLQYNASSPRFVNYTSPQTAIQLFKKEDAGAVETICSTPTITPEDGSKLYEKDAVSISTSTTDATIYYTINGDDPTAESQQYNAATGITFSEDGEYTIKAIAVKEGLDNSEVATATYTYAAVRPKWDMVTAATTLTDGIYVIAGNKDGVWKALGKDYNNKNKTNFKAIDVTVNEENKLLEPSAEVALVSLRKNVDGNWTLEVTNADASVAEGANFLTSVTIDENYLEMTDDQNPATITISETDNTAVIVFTGINERSIRYNDNNNIFACYTTYGQPIYLFKKPVVKPATPDATVNGATISNDGTIDLNGSAKTITFEGLAEGVNIWYKFEPAIAPQAEYSPEDGFRKYEASEGISLTQAGTLTYYAEKDGVVGDSHVITVTGTTTGISEIEADGVATEWFDLSGRRVAAPAKGVYLRKQGSKVTKVAY